MSQKFERFGKYILLEKLAAGGMAEVFLARAIGASGIGKFLAIKRILPQFSDNAEFIDMFKDEAKIAINLSHSNIVSLFEIGASAGQLFLVMEYVEGRNLRQILNKMKKSNTVFSLDQIVYMMKEVAGGLDHAHRCLDGSTGKPLNITHRDMSPQNVMISFEGEIKIVDFGIAKAETQMETTRAGTLKGKFGYMSPEQAEGQTVDLRTDIFSLGIVLWELLANDRLFIANNEVNTLRKIRDCQVPNLRKINPNVPPELEKIVYKALAKDRNLRYQTAAAFHRDLNRFLNRHYPDFSAQDFSRVMKRLYTDEILDNRNRLIEYAKTTQNISDNERYVPEETTFVTKTIGVSNTRTGAISNAPQFLDSETSTSMEDPLARQLEEMNADLERTKVGPKKNQKLKKSEIKAAVLDDDSILESLQKKIEVKAANPPSLKEFAEETDIAENFYSEDTGERTILSKKRAHYRIRKDYDNPNYDDFDEVTKSRIIKPPPAKAHARTDEKKSFNFMSLLMVVGIVVGSFVLLEQLFPNMMAPITKYFTGHSTELGLTGDAEEPVKPKKIEQFVPAGKKIEYVRTSIKSNPSGAAIYIDGKNTHKRTPSMVEVESGAPFELTLKKEGYKVFSNPRAIASVKKKVLRAKLTKQNFGFLYIDVHPPINTKLFIDEKPVKLEALPITNLPIASGKSVTIKAKNIVSGRTQTRKVNLEPDQKEKIIFKWGDSKKSSKKR